MTVTSIAAMGIMTRMFIVAVVIITMRAMKLISGCWASVFESALAGSIFLRPESLEKNS